jgi:hypothetical protein
MQMERRTFIKAAGFGGASVLLGPALGIEAEAAADSRHVTLEMTGLCLFERVKSGSTITSVNVHLLKAVPNHEEHNAYLTTRFENLAKTNLKYEVLIDSDGDPLCVWKINDRDLSIENPEQGGCAFESKVCHGKPALQWLPWAWNSIGWLPNLETIVKAETQLSVDKTKVHSKLTLTSAPSVRCARPHNNWGRELMFVAGKQTERQAYSDRVVCRVATKDAQVKFVFTGVADSSTETPHITFHKGEVHLFSAPTNKDLTGAESCPAKLHHFLAFYEAVKIPNGDKILPEAVNCPVRSASESTRLERIRTIEPVYCPPAMF